MSKLSTPSKRSHVSLLCILTSLFSSSPLAWLGWYHNCGIIRVKLMLTPPSSDRSHKILWEDAREREQKFAFYRCAFPLGRKVFNCQHGIDRTAGEKRKRKDAEEVLYIIISFYPQPLCYCQLWLANSKGQIHEWVIWHWSQNTFMTNVITVQSQLNWRWFKG